MLLHPVGIGAFAISVRLVLATMIEDVPFAEPRRELRPFLLCKHGLSFLEKPRVLHEMGHLQDRAHDGSSAQLSKQNGFQLSLRRWFVS